MPTITVPYKRHGPCNWHGRAQDSLDRVASSRRPQAPPGTTRHSPASPLTSTPRREVTIDWPEGVFGAVLACFKAIPAAKTRTSHGYQRRLLEAPVATILQAVQDYPVHCTIYFVLRSSVRSMKYARRSTGRIVMRTGCRPENRPETARGVFDPVRVSSNTDRVPYGTPASHVGLSSSTSNTVRSSKTVIIP